MALLAKPNTIISTATRFAERSCHTRPAAGARQAGGHGGWQRGRSACDADTAAALQRRSCCRPCPAPQHSMRRAALLRGGAGRQPGQPAYARHAVQVTATITVCCHSLLALVDAAGLSCARCRAPAPPSILLADADVLRVLRLRPATGLQFQRDSYAMPPL
jgi:hypothetical protein